MLLTNAGQPFSMVASAAGRLSEANQPCSSYDRLMSDAGVAIDNLPDALAIVLQGCHALMTKGPED